MIGDGQRRSLEIEVKIGGVSSPLLQIWRTESAPEMRVAVVKVLAMSIIN